MRIRTENERAARRARPVSAGPSTRRAHHCEGTRSRSRQRPRRWLVETSRSTLPSTMNGGSSCIECLRRWRPEPRRRSAGSPPRARGVARLHVDRTGHDWPARLRPQPKSSPAVQGHPPSAHGSLRPNRAIRPFTNRCRSVTRQGCFSLGIDRSVSRPFVRSPFAPRCIVPPLPAPRSAASQRSQGSARGDRFRAGVPLHFAAWTMGIQPWTSSIAGTKALR